MLDAIAAATEEMTGTTGVTAGFADLLCHLDDIDALDDLARSRRHLRVLEDRIARHARRLFVNTRRVVTDEAIDIFLGSKIEAFILPTVSNVTTHAAGVV